MKEWLFYSKLYLTKNLIDCIWRIPSLALSEMALFTVEEEDSKDNWEYDHHVFNASVQNTSTNYIKNSLLKQPADNAIVWPLTETEFCMPGGKQGADKQEVEVDTTDTKLLRLQFWSMKMGWERRCKGSRQWTWMEALRIQGLWMRREIFICGG